MPIPIVSRNGQWYFGITGWTPLVPDAQDKPKMTSEETKEAAKKGSLASAKAGAKMADDVAAGLVDPTLFVPSEEINTRVEIYKNAKVFQKESEHLLNQGWKVKTVDNEAPRNTVTRFALVGILAPLIKKRGRITVVWER